ncbi:MAG TPA: DUF2490 domain-containing protein [Flavobacteriales bacterium]|nr:DUF2490 domain-containing protein [Flavobacteriales bacterium]HMR26593.1 DUF2490 domain-containing protein [Flavobacteriales bacterium]
MHVLRLLCALALVLPAVNTAAQERSPLRPRLLGEAWGSIGVQFRPFRNNTRVKEPDFNKRFRMGVEAGYRSDENLSGGRQVYLDLGARYKFHDLLRVSLEHRFSFRGADRRNSQRTSVQVQSSQDLGRFTAEYRFRYQHEFLDPGEVRDQLRNRLGLVYDIRKWKLDPEVSVEFFTWAGNLGWRYIGTRYSVGTTWRPGKKHEVGVNVMHDRERYVYAPSYRFIYALSYTLELN